MMRRLSFILLALALGCTKKEAAPEPEVYVQAAHPTQGTISEQIAADATLAPLAQAAIAPRVTAPVRKFLVQRGARVKAGQLLATLEDTDLAAAALDTKGSYTAAQGTFAAATRAQVPEDTAKAQTDLAQARANLDLAQSIVTGRGQLFAQGAIPGRDLDTAKAALVQAQSAYDVAKLHLDSLQQVSRAASLQTAEGQLASAKGKYLGAEAQLGYTEVRSPIDGVVTDRPLFAGETAAAGTALITVMDTSALLAKLHIAQMQAQQLALGGEATVTVPGVDEPVPAKVALISPALDPGSTTVEVWLRVDNRAGKLKAGTPVRASIIGRTVPDALLLPAAAVQTAPDGSAKYVMVIAADGTARKRPVTLGIQTPDSVQVLSGLGPADTVITTGSYGLDDKTKVKIGAPPDAKEAGDK
jgi:multidrug efflux pump subunit AcrA (membrane-fusion protein)